jgi:hypothetical protein
MRLGRKRHLIDEQARVITAYLMPRSIRIHLCAYCAISNRIGQTGPWRRAWRLLLKCSLSLLTTYQEDA